MDETLGYQATSTLAGSRLKTDLDDVATTISVVTEEFLEDTAADNARELLVYTAGTEVSGYGGNFTGAQLTAGVVNDDAALRAFSTNNRVRGLATADTARNYFISSIPFDSYNTSRVEINRGSNSVLFGLGSPAGIINNTTQTADFTDSVKVDLSFGSWGSTRTSFNINRQIIESEFAIRVAGVREAQEFEQNPAFEDSERVYLAATYSKDFFGESPAWGKTTLRANFENGEINANRPRTLPPSDLITPFFTPFTDDVLGEYNINFAPKPEWDMYTMALDTGFDLNAEPGHWVRGVVTDPNTVTQDWPRLHVYLVDDIVRGALMVFEGEDNLMPSDPGGENVIGRQGYVRGITRERFGSVKYPQSFFMGMSPLNNVLAQWQGFDDGSGSSGSLDYSGLFTNPLVSDRSLFDYRKQLLDGPNKHEGAEFEVASFSLEQLFFGDKAGMEISWSGETFEQDQMTLIGSGSRRGLGIDINTRLTDGTINPNYGRPYVNSRTSFSYDRLKRDNIRATAFGEFDFTEKDGIGRWLGKHMLTGLYSEYQEDRLAYWGVPYYFGRDMVYGDDLNPWTSTGRKVGSIHYLGGPIDSRSTSAGANVPNIKVDQWPSAAKSAGGVWRLHPNRSSLGGVTHDTSAGFVADQPLSIIDNFVRDGEATKNQYDSTAFVLQSYLLNSNIVGTLSWREDAFDARTNGSPSLDGDLQAQVTPDVFNTDLEGTNVLSGSEEITSYGVVAKVPQPWLDKISILSGAQVQYTESENFQPAGVRIDNFYNPIGSPSGETKDYGFTLSMFESKLNIRGTWYETSQNSVNAGQFDGVNGDMTRMYGDILEAAALTIGGGNEISPMYIGFQGDSVQIDSNLDGNVDFLFNPPNSEYLAQHDFTFNGTSYQANVDASIRNTQDTVSEGFELEVVCNPSKSWRFLFNASKQKALITGLGDDLVSWMNTYPFWDIDGDGTAEASYIEGVTGQYADLVHLNVSTGNTMQGVYEQFIRGWLSSLEVQNGKFSDELREWRANLVTNYAFTEGRFSGFNIGSAIRWEDAPVIGYPMTSNPVTGATISDLESPIMGNEHYRVDAWVGYEKEIMDGETVWKVQLNIRNVFNDDDDVPIQANPDGRIVASRIGIPISWELRNTFEF